MILPIYLYGHPVLRLTAEPVDLPADELQALIANMWETMYHSGGIGLAAPQVGRSIKLIVIDGSAMAEDFEECRDFKLTLINPELEVIEDAEPVTRDEGCLSLPGMSEPVKRTEHVHLTWTDENGTQRSEEFSGFAARIIQHEFDHLLGKVYTDRVSPIRRQLAKSKLTAIARGRVNCDYPVRSTGNRRR